ncbi:MAG TPA: LptE family protein [Phycisphaerae bacterium]|nr:LptE family protein [Phycisphaerae bacterium]
MRRLTAILLTLLAGATAVPGCSNDPNKGYTFKSPYPSGVKTVAVPIWGRGKYVYRRGLEFRLTEALQKQVELDTPYKVVRKPRADTELTGTIDQIAQRPLSINPDTGRPREMEITFFVSFKWTDLRSGEVLVERTNFRVAGTYLPAAGFNEDFFQGSEDVIDRLAARIVEQMEVPFTR